MNKYIRFLLLLVSFFPAAAYAGTYNIVDFGAAADGRTINTKHIQQAVNKCRDDGGGTVIVPRGIFLSGTIQLFSNIELHLEPGAVLMGSADAADYYLDSVRLGLIYTENAENVFITGPGRIDGNGDAYVKLNEAKVFPYESIKYTRQKEHYREVLSGVGDGPLVPLDRPYQMIIFSNCRNVNVTDVMISNSPFWTLHLADCDGVIISNIKIRNNLLIPNNDGIDLTSCSNALISNCDIRTGDDAIVLTGYAYHFDLPGYKNLRHDSKNITVTNCYLVSRSSAIRIGGWDQNFMKNYTFSNIVIDSSNRGINLCVRDSCGIEDVVFTNMIIKTRLHTGDWWGNGEPIHLSVIRGKEKVPIGAIKNVKFSHILAEGESGMLVYNSGEGIIENISFEDISFRLKSSSINSIAGGNFDLRPATGPELNMFSHNIPAFYAQNVNNVQLRNFEINWENIKEPYFTNAVEFKGFNDIVIEGLKAAAADPGNNAVIKLSDGKGYKIINNLSPAEGTGLLSKENVKE